ncbi:uncharacterized protein LOC120434453 isoform X1 [Oreochromis aureus]|uniref:uncharacterized protein LOC120434453 isoform X1 n=1 Tax=Oreochromis aureus TaxID=47969 RepID=UPI0019549E08|nr:uncharacterized protein LOC120434453 isoform X1 [Oreochromis aureus]
MEVRSSIRLLMNVLLLLVIVVEFSDCQTHNSGFPQVVPNRQQFFQSEPITISCEGLNELTGWRVMKKINGDVRTCASTWETSIGPCNIINAYPSTDSGEYWCEMGGIQKSNTVNITVTGHSPIPYFKLYLGLCTGFSVLLVVVILLGVFQRHKHQQTIRSHTEETSLRPGVENSTASFKSPSAHTVPVVVSIAEENHETYSLITKTTMSKEDRALESVQETNAMARKPSDVKEMAVGGGKEVPAPN